MLADDGVTYARPGRGTAALAARPGAAAHRRGVVVAARGRPRPARRAAQRDPRRPVRRAAAARRRDHPARRGASATRASPGWSPGRRRSTRGRWCWPPPTWVATPRGGGGCSPTGPRRRRGIGYAMENRRVISRVLPELYREAGLHRMEPYFWALRSALLQSAPGRPGRPAGRRPLTGDALGDGLRPGLRGLALGFPLVQGSDLVVRDGWVWMRAPGRLGSPATGWSGST